MNLAKYCPFSLSKFIMAFHLVMLPTIATIAFAQESDSDLYFQLKAAFERNMAGHMRSFFSELTEKDLETISPEKQYEIYRIAYRQGLSLPGLKQYLGLLVDLGLRTTPPGGELAVKVVEAGPAQYILDIGPTKKSEEAPRKNNVSKSLLAKLGSFLTCSSCISANSVGCDSDGEETFKENHLHISAGTDGLGQETASKYPWINVIATDLYSLPSLRPDLPNFQVKKIDNSKEGIFTKHFQANSMDRIVARAGACFCNMDPSYCCLGIPIKGKRSVTFWREMIKILNKKNPSAEAVFMAGDTADDRMDRLVENAKLAAVKEGAKVSVERTVIRDKDTGINVFAIRLSPLP